MNPLIGLIAATSLMVGPAPMDDTVAREKPSNPAPAGVTISSVKATGTGCRDSTVAVGLSPDREAFTLTYSAFLAQVGVGAKPADQRRFCKVHMKVDIPKDYTYGITRVDYRGYTQLAPGATARHEAFYNFPGRNEDARHGDSFTGPREDNWDSGMVTKDNEYVEAPCGKAHQVKIETSLSVDAGTSDVANTTSYITVDSMDGVVKSLYRWHWRKCRK